MDALHSAHGVRWRSRDTRTECLQRASLLHGAIPHRDRVATLQRGFDKRAAEQARAEKSDVRHSILYKEGFFWNQDACPRRNCN
jgi:hypothetical protein